VGQVLTRRTRAGDTLSFTYDDLGRMTQKAVPNSPTITSEYDLAGRVTKVTSSDGQEITNTFDGVGRTTAVATKFPSATTRTVNYTYNDNSRLTSMVWPDSYTINYAYDNLGRMTTATEDIDGTGTTTKVLATYSYDDLSRRTGVTLGNNVGDTAYGFWADNALKSLDHDFNASCIKQPIQSTCRPIHICAASSTFPAGQ
jgi:YD repeat-containing protein